MFATVEFIAPQSGIKPRLQHFVHPPVPQKRQVAVPSGVSFCALRVPLNRNPGKKNAPLLWKSVQNAAGRFAGKLLVPDASAIPAESGCAALICAAYRQTLLLNSGLALLQRTKADPANLIFSVIDPQAQFLSRLRHLVPFCATLRLVTNEPDYCRHAQEELLDAFGASLLLSQEPESVQNSHIVFDLCGERPVHAPQSIVFTHPEWAQQSTARFVVTGNGVLLPERYRNLLPQGIDEAWFAAALFEQCRCAPLGTLCYQTLSTNGIPCATDTLAAQIRRLLLDPSLNALKR